MLRYQTRYIKYNDVAQGFLVLLLFAQLFFFNGIYLFIGALVFGFVLYNLQLPYKPSVFTIIFLYHFLQVSAGVWLSNYLGVDINFRSANLGTATIVSYIGLVILFLPIIYYQKKIPPVNKAELVRLASNISIRKVFIAYIILYFVTNSLSAVAFRIEWLTQIILALVNLKWVIFLFFGFVSVLKREMQKIFILAIALEFISGFFSFFSDFKMVIFFVTFVLLTFVTEVKFKNLFVAILGVLLAAYLGIFWTSIKGEYRKFLNQGTRTQKVQVTQEEALNKLVDLVQQGREDSENDPAAGFLDRLQYTFHLAKTMDNVPATIPFQQGSNWGESIAFVFTPRVLNPEKPRFEATVKTRKYTGLAYAGAKQGASFSLGYFADSYIDFGLVGMFFPIVLIGFAFGSIYFYFIKNASKNYLLNICVVGALFMEFTAFEADGTRLLGRIYIYTLTFYLLKIFFFPWFLRQVSIPVVHVNEKDTVNKVNVTAD